MSNTDLVETAADLAPKAPAPVAYADHPARESQVTSIIGFSRASRLGNRLRWD